MKNVTDFKTPEKQAEFLEARKARKAADFALDHARIALVTASLHVRELEAKPEHSKLMPAKSEMLEAKNIKNIAAFSCERARIALMSASLQVRELEEANNE